MSVRVFFISLFSAASLLAAGARDQCDPDPPATCYPDDCCRTYCLGPDNYAVNAPVNPITCNGDWEVTVAGFYWHSCQKGLEYAVETKARVDRATDLIPSETNIIDAEYKNPDFKWDFGFKVGLGYNSTCDGWDFGVLWTRYDGKASSHDEAENDDNRALLPIWTNFATSFISSPPASNLPTFATDIETQWNLDLDLIDIDLGRKFWTSPKLSLRPHVGVRVGYIRQSFTINHKGGTWSVNAGIPAFNAPQNNTVNIDNDFKGVGIRTGLDTLWHFGCGWAVYGDTALSILYGRFHIDHDEMNRAAESPFTKNKFFETKEGFHCSTFVVDLTLGIQWSSLFCDCQYGLTAKLGWEQHLFFDQNQMWRVTKGFAVNQIGTGQGGAIFTNEFNQRRGDLDTQGWTLTFVFDF